MKTSLLVLTAIALGLQGIAHAASPADEPLERVQAADEIWGIGLRSVQAQAAVAPTPGEDTAGAHSIPELESAFWACDYVATTRGVDATPVAICGAVYDELKTLKFGGDFGDLLAWWKQNKPAEHERLEREERDATIEHVGDR